MAVTTRDLPIDGVRFPARCVACGGAPGVTFEISAARGVDLVFNVGRDSAFAGPFIAFAHRVWVPVPVCAACRRRRRLAWVLAVLGLLCALVALIAAFVAVFGPDIDGGGFAVILALSLAVLWWGRNRLEPLLDRYLLRVEGVTVLRAERRVRLGFRDAPLADEVARRSRGDGARPELDVDTAG